MADESYGRSFCIENPHIVCVAVRNPLLIGFSKKHRRDRDDKQYSIGDSLKEA